MRCFIGVPLKDWEEKVGEILDTLAKKTIGIRWVKKENIHITLKFLGETPEEKLASLSRVLKDIVPRYSAFYIERGELGAFPSSASPRVIWLGILDTSGNLSRIAQDIEDGLVVYGWEKERRRFHPHITLGRVKGGVNRKWWEKMRERELPDFPPIRVEEVILYQSILSPQGASYKPLEKVKLGG